MQKLLIRATKELATKLEEKLRHHYDGQLHILDDNTDVCEIKVKVRREWITLCRFASKENLKDILTMFQVNELKAGRRSK